MVTVEGSAIEIDEQAKAMLKQFYKEYVEELTECIRRYGPENDRKLLSAFIHDVPNAMKEALEKAFRLGVVRERTSEVKALRSLKQAMDSIDTLQKELEAVGKLYGFVKGPPLRCAYCGALAEGKYLIHRDGLGLGPEMALCNGCGGSSRPTEAEVWSRIGQAKKCLKCDEPIRPEHTRFGSFHARCFG